MAGCNRMTAGELKGWQGVAPGNDTLTFPAQMTKLQVYHRRGGDMASTGTGVVLTACRGADQPR